jgi:hypothetical protein
LKRREYNEDWNLVYEEDSNWNWKKLKYDKDGELFSYVNNYWTKRRRINWKNFEYKDWKFFYGGEEVFLKNNL